MTSLQSSNTRTLSTVGGNVSVTPIRAQGPKGEDGSNVLPTDEAVKNAIENTSSLTRAALEVAKAQIGSSVVNEDGDAIEVQITSEFWISAADPDFWYGPEAEPRDPDDIAAYQVIDGSGAVRLVEPFSAGVSDHERILTLEGSIPSNPLGAVGVAWPATTAVDAYALYRLPTGGLGYCSTARTTRATWDATERDLWTFLPGGHHERLTSGTSWKSPLGIVNARIRLTGGGGQGGGGGTGHASTQVGGGGGGAGAAFEAALDGLVGATSYACVIGAGGSAAGGGGTAGGGAGANGSAGSATTFTGPGSVQYRGSGGGAGVGGAASSSTTVAGGAFGCGGTVSTAFLPGSGGTGSSSTGNGCAPCGPTVGGGGGGPANATLGGNGGDARILPGTVPAGVNTKTATAAGGAGVTPTEYGCGGGGGGAGSTTGGAGGAGAPGAQGCIDLWF